MDPSGNIGIGTTTPRSNGKGTWLDVNGGLAITNTSNLGTLDLSTWASGGLIGWNKTSWAGEVDFVSLSGGGGDGGFAFYDHNNLSLRILKGGNVGIGTAAPQYPLSVNGIIQAKEVQVNANWSDYVFAPGYKVKPLDEVAAYVAANHHLPDIPSAAEVEQKGVSVGEMESKLLAKVEELTLQLIEVNRANEKLQQDNQSWKKGSPSSKRAKGQREGITKMLQQTGYSLSNPRDSLEQLCATS